MKLFAVSIALLVSSCAHLPQREASLVGTWSGGPGLYYLRIYADGRVAAWPMPDDVPQDPISWTRQQDGALLWGASERSHPRLAVEGKQLTMTTSVGVQRFERITPDLEPGVLPTNRR